MTLKVSSYGSSGGLSNKIAHQSTVTQTVDEDVLGTSGTIISVDIDNQHSATIFLKMKTTTGSYVSGTTYPDHQFRIPGSTSKRFDFTSGLRFSQLTFWCNSGGEYDSTTSPGGTVLVTFICS